MLTCAFLCLLCSVVTKEEGERILAEREDVLRDRPLLQAIADRTGIYIPLEVRCKQ
jgi:hypothetical protein